MINWKVSFETFTMATMQVSRLRKNLIFCLQPMKFEKIMHQRIRAKQAHDVSTMEWHGTTVASRSVVHYQKTPESLQKLPKFSLNFSDTNQNQITKVEGFLCCKKKNLNGREVTTWIKHIRKLQDLVECLRRRAAAKQNRAWRLITTVYLITGN